MHSQTYPLARLLLLFPLGIFRRAKFVDFGLSEVLEPGEVIHCNAAGTPGYMAPEVAQMCLGMFSCGAGRSSDWWSLGIIIWEMALGEIPAPFLVRNELGDYNVPAILHNAAHCDSFESLR